MFRRDVKKQFNDNKYNLLTRKGANQTTHMQKLPFAKQMVGSMALMVIGFNFTKRYFTMPHHHKDNSKPMVLSNGQLHPYEFYSTTKVSDKLLAKMIIECDRLYDVRKAQELSFISYLNS